MLLVALGVGATLVPLPDFSPGRWRELSPLGVTHATVVPALIEAALAANVLALPTLECILYGSSPLHPDTARRLLVEFPGIRLVQNLGQTEGSPITTLSAVDHVDALAHAVHRLGSVGRATEGTQLRIEGADAVGNRRGLLAGRPLLPDRSRRMAAHGRSRLPGRRRVRLPRRAQAGRDQPRR